MSANSSPFPPPAHLVKWKLFFFSFFFFALARSSLQKKSHNSAHVVEHISHESLCLSAGCRLMTLTVKKTLPLHRLSVRCVREVRLPSGALIGTAFVSPDTDYFIFFFFFSLWISGAVSFLTDPELYVTDNKHSLRSFNKSSLYIYLYLYTIFPSNLSLPALLFFFCLPPYLYLVQQPLSTRCTCGIFGGQLLWFLLLLAGWYNIGCQALSYIISFFWVLHHFPPTFFL